MKKFTFATIALIFMTASADPHSWYPSGCCSGSDCEPVEIAHINELRDGWQIDACSATRMNPSAGSLPPTHLCISGFVKRGDEKVSQDGNYHLCFNATRIICFFAPVNT